MLPVHIPQLIIFAAQEGPQLAHQPMLVKSFPEHHDCHLFILLEACIQEHTRAMDLLLRRNAALS